MEINYRSRVAPADMPLANRAKHPVHFKLGGAKGSLDDAARSPFARKTSEEEEGAEASRVSLCPMNGSRWGGHTLGNGQTESIPSSPSSQTKAVGLNGGEQVSPPQSQEPCSATSSFLSSTLHTNLFSTKPSKRIPLKWKKNHPVPCAFSPEDLFTSPFPEV